MLSKYAAACEFTAEKVDTHADATEATLEMVPHATFPSASVTAGAAKTLAVEYTQNPVGEATVTPPVTVGVTPARTSVF